MAEDIWLPSMRFGVISPTKQMSIVSESWHWKLSVAEATMITYQAKLVFVFLTGYFTALPVPYFSGLALNLLIILIAGLSLATIWEPHGVGR